MGFAFDKIESADEVASIIHKWYDLLLFLDNIPHQDPTHHLYQ